MSDKDILDLEAEAFDDQIDERIANGHIPDLRRSGTCDWFRTNNWRKDYFVQLDFGEIFRKIDTAIREHGPERDRPLRLLEIGCGPGHLSLEFARAGYATTGLELSPRCIEIARRFADEDPWAADRAPLDYVAGDIFSNDVLDIDRFGRAFDVAVFVGALHHFPDQDAVLDRARDLLAPGGLVIAHEPTRDRMTKPAAILHLLVKAMAAAGGNYRETVDRPKESAQLTASLDAILRKLKYEEEDGEKVQSPNDNEAGYPEMTGALAARFDQVQLDDTYAFFHEVIGGFDYDDTTNRELGWLVRELDQALVSTGAIQATEFFYVGRKRA